MTILALALSTFPVFTVDHPPIQDLPSAVGRIWLEHRLWEGNDYESRNFYFTLPPPYALHDAGVVVLTRILDMPPLPVFLWLDTAVWLALLAAVIRVCGKTGVQSGLAAAPLVGCLIRWNASGQFGNFSWRAGEALLLIAYTYLLLDTPRSRKSFWYWIAPFILYFTHLFAYAFWCIMAITALGGVYSTRDLTPTRKRHYTLACLGCTPPILYHLVRHAVNAPAVTFGRSLIEGTPASSPYRWIPHNWSELRLFGGIFMDERIIWSVWLALALGLIGCISVAVSRKDRSVEDAANVPESMLNARFHTMQTLVMYACALLLPHVSAWPGPSPKIFFHYANVRALEVAAVMSGPLICLALPPAGHLRRTILPLILACALVLQSLGVCDYFVRSDALQKKIFGNWPSQVRPHQRFYSVVFVSLAVYPALPRYPHYASERATYEAHLFEDHFWVWPRHAMPLLGISASDMEAYRRPDFTGSYDAILMAGRFEQPSIDAYAAFWRERFPSGQILTLSPFARLFLKD